MLRGAVSTIVPARHAGDAGAPDRFPLMDSIRALAALMIVVYHASLSMDVGSGARSSFETLAIGVPVFFVVSGFLLYRPFAVALLTGRRGPRTAAFAWRRFLRIVPAFWVALTVVALAGESTISLSSLPPLYGFAQVYDADTLHLGLPQAWSLDCEIVFYAMLPLVAVVLRRAPGSSPRARLWWQVAGLVALVALSEGYKVWFHTFGDLRSVGDQAFSFHPGWNLDMFVAGMALALWSAHHEVTGRETRMHRLVARRSGLLWVGAALLFSLVTNLAPEAREAAGNAWYHLARIAFGVVLVLPAIHGSVHEGRVRRWLRNRWLLALGVVSYGLYLFHLQVIAVVFDLGLPDVVLLGLTLAGAVALACVSWVLIERPALRLRHLVQERREPAATEPLGAADQVLARVPR